MTEGSDDRVAIPTGIAAGLGMLALTLINIGRSFGYDEGYTYLHFINGGSLRRALFTQVVFNNHPTFSAIQVVGWRLGLVGETAQRLGPAMAAAGTVGLLAWYTTRRVGPVAGLSAAVLLALNPTYLENARQLRGYALSAFAVVIAGLAIERSWHDHRRRWLVAQGLAMVIAVTTHSYAAVTLLMIAVASLALRRLRPAHIVTWLAAAGVALLLQVPILDDQFRATRARGSQFYPSRPILIARALLGSEWPVVIVTGIAVLAGAIVIARRSHRHVEAVAGGFFVLAGVVLLLWQVMQPRDFYPRFFLSTLPLICYLAARGIALLPRYGREAAVIAVAVLLVPGTTRIFDQQPTMRDAAAVADRARALDAQLCGRHAEPLFVYTPPFQLISGLGDFGDCEVYISVLGVDQEARAFADEQFDSSQPLGGSVIVWADSSVIGELTDGLGDR